MTDTDSQPTTAQLKRSLHRAIVVAFVQLLAIVIVTGVVVRALVSHQHKAHDKSAKQALTVAFEAARMDSIDRKPLGSFGSAADLRAVLAKDAPQLDVAASDTPGKGEVAVCADTGAAQLHLSALSKTGQSYSLFAPANGAETIKPGSCNSSPGV
jgi:hypothetical protein